MFTELNTKNLPSILIIIYLLQCIARFCNNTKAEKFEQDDNFDIIATIYSITHLVKNQSFNIKAIKNCIVKPQVENTIFYKDVFICPFSFKLEPVPFEINKVILKINN